MIGWWIDASNQPENQLGIVTCDKFDRLIHPFDCEATAENADCNNRTPKETPHS